MLDTVRQVFQPKQFYRDLERLLHETPSVTGEGDWFARVAREIVERFGTALFLASWRLYEEEPGGFVLTAGSTLRGDARLLVPGEYPPIRLVLKHGVYIFDATVEGSSPELEERLGSGPESAALLLRGEPRRIVAFGLRPGWERDNLDFTLNTLRNAIDLRTRLRHLKSEFEQAAEIQRSLLPDRLPELPGFSLAATSVPAEAVGGDLYDFLPGDAETIALTIGDASGHGLSAALMARDVVTGFRMGHAGGLKISEVVGRLNRVIALSRLSSRFVSLFAGELDSDGTLSYVNAGHPPALILGPGATRRLEVGGTILGPAPESAFRSGWARLRAGEVFVAVTDGMLERLDEAGRMFGEEGVERSVRRDLGRPAPEILRDLFADVWKHGGGRPGADDATAIVVARGPSGIRGEWKASTSG
ncbi:MAG: PP2C family protein-serine/threonine phosphatase [bacterium]